MSRDSLLLPGGYPSTREGRAETWLAQVPFSGAWSHLNLIFQDLLVLSYALSPDSGARPARKVRSE